MSTYTAHPVRRIHLHRPQHRVWLALGVTLAAALVGLVAWALVDHYTATGRHMTDTQAVTFIQTGKGLPGMNANGGALPASRQAYALRVFRAGPYGPEALNLYYALGATATHFASKTQRQAMVAPGWTTLVARVERTIRPASIVTRYGVTVREAAEATVRGMLDAAA